MSTARNPKIHALRIIDPPAWRQKVIAAIKQHGNIRAAAEALDVGYRTMFDWLAADPELDRALSAYRDELRGGNAGDDS